MTNSIPASLCVAIIFSFLFSTSATGQSVAPPKLLPPAAVALKIKIDSKQEYADELKQKLEATRKSQAKTVEKLKAIDTWEREIGVSMESFPEIVKSLQSKRIDLMIDLTGLKAKREAILAAGKKKNAIQMEIMSLEQMVAAAKTELDKKYETKDSTLEAQARLGEVAHRLTNTRSKDKTTMLLAESMLATSLELAEKKARLALVNNLIADVLPARKQLESAASLKAISQKTREQEMEINERFQLSERELAKLKQALQEIIAN